MIKVLAVLLVCILPFEFMDQTLYEHAGTFYKLAIYSFNASNYIQVADTCTVYPHSYAFRFTYNYNYTNTVYLKTKRNYTGNCTVSTANAEGGQCC